MARGIAPGGDIPTLSKKPPMPMGAGPKMPPTAAGAPPEPDMDEGGGFSCPNCGCKLTVTAAPEPDMEGAEGGAPPPSGPGGI